MFCDLSAQLSQGLHSVGGRGHLVEIGVLGDFLGRFCRCRRGGLFCRGSFLWGLLDGGLHLFLMGHLRRFYRGLCLGGRGFWRGGRSFVEHGAVLFIQSYVVFVQVQVVVFKIVRLHVVLLFRGKTTLRLGLAHEEVVVLRRMGLGAHLLLQGILQGIFDLYGDLSVRGHGVQDGRDGGG